MYSLHGYPTITWKNEKRSSRNETVFPVKMETNRLNTNLKSGISIDDVHKIRVLDSDTAAKTEQLRTQCLDFIESTTNFEQIVDGFLTVIESLAKNVEKEKMRAIGSSNLLSSMSKIREAEQIQLQILLMERSMELERLRLQYQSLLKTKQEQQEYIDLLTSNK